MIDWYSVLLDYGISVPHMDQIVIHCPLHDDRRESCAINLEKGVWVCFAGCGQGSLKSLIWKVSGKPWKQINEELDEKEWEFDFDLLDSFGIEEVEPEPEPETPELFEVPSGHWIYKRGFIEETIQKWGCKCDAYDNLWIPVKTVDEKIVGWVTRRQYAIPKYMYSYGFKKSNHLFGINHAKNRDQLYIVEGSLDAMWVDEHHYTVLGILGAIVSQNQINLVSTLNPGEVVLALDNDDAGQKGIAKATFDMGNRFLLSYLKIPRQYKDVQDIQDINILNKVMKNTQLW